jgi:NAD(P)-dependent dehydrogenase (short-subunit alcohol dehydrogenase family)
MADMVFEGKVALVTGGASGIGRATVRALAAEGATVAVVDRDEAGATAVAAEVTGVGGAATAHVVDLADPSAIAPLVERVLADHGRIDVLVNSAGMSGAPHSAVEFRDEIMELVLSVNLRAPMLLVREVGRHMIERGGGGRIVSLSSSAAFRSTSSPVVYAATKAGINGMTRAAAADLGPHDVNVNAVAPGLTATPMVGLTEERDNREQLNSMVSSGPLANLLHRVSEPEDVANVIAFLCRPESRQITGQVINTSAGLIV